MADKPTAAPGFNQVSRYQTLWRRLFSVKGASPEPQPVLIVQGGYDDIELALLRDEVPFAGYSVAPAVAGEFSGCSITMQEPGFIARIEQMVLWSATADIVTVKLVAAGAVGGLTFDTARPSPRDTRRPNAPNTPLAIYHSHMPALPPPILGYQVQLQAGIPVWLPIQWVIHNSVAPGQAAHLMVWHETVNLSLNASFIGRYRTYEPSELAT